MGNLQTIELEFLRTLRDLSSPIIDAITEFITMFGEQYIMVFLLIVIYFAYNKVFGKKLAYIIFSSLCLNGSVKGIVQRTRPFVVDPSLDSVRKETATGFSFPSGHTQNSSTIYLGIAYNNTWKKRVVWIIAITLSILIALSRLVLAVHYPTDVLVGFIFGTICAVGLSFIYNKYAKDLNKETILFLITFILFLQFCFIFYKKNYSDIYIYKNFYTAYAMFGGFIIGNFLEGKFVNFNNETTLLKKIFRLIGAVVLYIIINFGLKAILPSENIFCDIFRYFMITFVIIGIYPIVFKNLLFKKNEI